VRYTIVMLVAIVAAIAAPTASARVSPSQADQKKCDKLHMHECHKLMARVKKLEKAVEWQKKNVRKQVADLLARTRGHQPFAYAAKLAYLACVAFRGMGNPDCRPPGQMLTVGRCESGLQIDDPNPVSTASNWMQYLDSTWANAPAGRLGFYKLDVLAVAIQTEAKAMSGWHEWQASQGCHGLA
jgi:hypothetical protein